MTLPAYRRDGRPVPQSAFYATACDPRRHVVVEACAGSGKTWMLVARIVRALLDGTPPQAILAITFTRKAAGEMRERLVAVLRELATASVERRHAMLVERGMDDAAARAAAADAATLLDRVLEGGRPVEVRTFHAWFAQLMRAAPWDVLQPLGLSPQMTLVEDREDLRPDLMRAFHARVLADSALHDDYRALVASRGRTTLLRWLDAAWERRIELELADAEGVLDGAVPAAQALWPAFAGLGHPAAHLRRAAARTQWLGLARELAAGKAAARAAATAVEQALGEADDAACLEGLRNAVLTQRGEVRKHLVEGPALRAAVAMLAEVDDAMAQDEAHREHAAMVRLSRVLLAEYAALKRRQGLVDMADLELVALRLLSDPVVSGWIHERLDARLRHLLIDEFQDTSPLQWHALQSWLAGYAGAGAGAPPLSVFIVGDPKQSIYRFRRAEPRVFEAARGFVVEGLGGHVLECDHTRRNAPAVLSVVNAVFAQAAAQGAYAGFRAHTTAVDGPATPSALWALDRVPRPARGREADDGGATHWRPSLRVPRHDPEEVLREREAALVADAVQAWIAQGCPAGEIFVLARKRASLRYVAQALQARHVAFAAPEDTRLGEQVEVRDLLALLDALASPGQDLSLAHALKSPLFGAGDDDLVALARAAGPGRWWDALQGSEANALSPALQRARGLLARWAAAAPTLPPHDLLDRIVAEGDLWSRLAAAAPPERWPAAQHAVRALLSLALELDGGRYASVYGFVRALRRRTLKVRPDVGGDAVQLLTVHAAKGLEARAVVLTDCDPERQNDETATLLVEWPVDRPRPRRVAFLASEGRCPPSLRDLLNEERAQRDREALNGLYVALTRSRERLLISATEPYRASETSWWQRLQPLAAPLDRAPTGTAAERAARPARVPVLPAPTLPGRPREPGDGRAAPASPAARLGQAVHRLLEWITRPGADLDLDGAATSAARAFDLPSSMGAEVARRAATILRHPDAARFFGPGLRWSGNEVPIADAAGSGRIDRLVCLDTDEGPEWWVIDYKLALAPGEVEAYREQLARYREAVRALQPGERVRAAFVTGSGTVVEL